MEPIRRKPHSSVVFGLITKLYQNNELIDCMLDCEGGLVKAHKVVLAACSPYFKNLFMHHKGLITVPLKEIKYNDLKNILDLIYYGEIDVPVTDVETLKRAAKYLQVTPLKRFVSSNFSEKFPLHDASEKCTSYCRTAKCFTLTKNDEEDLCLHGTQRVNVTGKELSANLQNADSGTYNDAEREMINEIGELKSSENELHILSSDVIGKEIKNEVPESLENEITPFSFATVPSFSLKNEEPVDQDTTSSEAELNSQCEQLPCDLVMMKEADLDSESTLEMESGDETYFSELSKTEDEYSVSSTNPSGHYLKLSCEQFRGSIGGNSVQSSEKVSGIDTMRNTTFQETDSSGQCTDHQVFTKSEDLQVEFESTCDISELVLKEEKPFISMNLQNIVEYDNEHGISSEQRKSQLEVDNNNADSDDPFGMPCKSIEPEVVEVKISPQNHDPLNCPQCVIHFRKKYEELLISPSGKYDKASHASPSELTRSSSDIAKINIDRNIRYNCEALFCPKPNHKLQMVGKVGKPYQCNICNASFIAHPHLLVHKRIHSGYRPYICTICSKSFNVAGSLKRHILTHTGEKPYLCRVCLKTFRTKDTLQSHFRTHTGERPYACDLCEKSYSTKTGLTLHLRSHTGEKPYVCCVCNKAFRLLPNLNGHMRVHTGEKPYPCDICNKSFRERNHLKRHALTHTGEKQFSCVKCNKSYARIRQLKSHMRAHRKENIDVIAAQTNS